MTEGKVCGKHDFYRAFEDRHRGSRESIVRRLAVYLPYVQPLLAIYPDPTPTVVDLGCGRGEWLELMGQNGFNAVGVDTDEGMLSACTERGLKGVSQDAITFLKTLAENSQCVVSGFHIVEHIPFSDLKILVEEALRVLKPGGLLILETPNPENVAVGTTNFYLDPTHQRPIPPLLLEFLPDYFGFERVKILRLQESQELVGKEGVELIDVFFGASPDYAIVAQKSAGLAVMTMFDEIFGQPHGIELGELANRFDAKLDRRFVTLEQRVANAENLAGEAERVLDRFASLHERLLAEAVRAERTRATTALLAEQLCSANSRLRAAERELAVVKDHAEQFESRATAAESCIGELEARLAAADERAEALERRVVAAETEAAEQEYRAGLAYAFIEELELRVVDAETRAEGLEERAGRGQASGGELECRVPVSQAQLDELKRRVVAALMQVNELEHRAISAESRVGELEYVVFEAGDKADELERQAVAAEADRAEHERRATLAERQVVDLNNRVSDALARAEELGNRLAEVENCSKLLERRAAAAEAALAEQERRAITAETMVPEIESKLAAMEATWRHDIAGVGELQAERDELQRAVVAAQGSAHFWHTESERWHARLSSVHRSNSWRITAPIRAVKRIATGDFSPVGRATGLITRGVRRALRPPAVAAARAALSQPGLRLRVGAILRKYPRLRDHVALFVRNAGLVPGSTVPICEAPLEANYSLGSPDSPHSITKVEPDLSTLPVNARNIYHDLQAAIRRNGQGGE